MIKIFLVLFIFFSSTNVFADDLKQEFYTYGKPSFDGIGKFYMDREISGVIGGGEAILWLERPDRTATEQPDVLIKALNLKPADIVADIGAGSGYFTFRIAPLISEGKIYAVEIGEDMIKFLMGKKAKLNAQNVIPRMGTITDVKLPEESIDLVLIVDAYHEFSHPREMMESIVYGLKPGGRVVLVEYRAEDPAVPMKPLHKMSEAQVKKEMGALGLQWIETNDDLPMQHIIFFQKNK